ncbi:hypothetical protein GF386_01620 [Candidatus Pacearchaeota archaeon]|nr:hypothetical protein [Candidatus Pacearchaeota archaeon]MBD3282878.1 hypothetical protein [Candidatus Pacearchaeota archaeon]
MINKEVRNSRRAQVTIFVILAIVIVIIAGIIAYLIYRSSLEKSLPREVDPVYDYYLGCIEENVLDGALILGQQAGYIDTPEFYPGSMYIPFSSQLNFLGSGVPYWYYISGNGISREQVPTKEKMQSQLSGYLEERILQCDLSQFSEQGFQINLSSDIDVESEIEKNKIVIKVIQDMDVGLEDVAWSGNKHELVVNSNLGKHYDLAKKIYDYNMDEMFLENYGVDILRLYAPVDGVELGCSSLIWPVWDIRENLTRALEGNIPAIKVKGDYYVIKKEEHKYFVNDIGEDVDINVNFMYLREWPMKLEIWPSEEGYLRADPVGLQEGLGMLGFCYVPYHFVYDFGFPVMIQLFEGKEMFQFPVVVFIEKNKPREASDVEGLPNVVPGLCQHKNTKARVYTYNTNLEPIPAHIKYKCFDTTCDMGYTIPEGNDFVLSTDFPQCVNGYVIASSPGYKPKKQLVPRIEGGINVVLDREYLLEVEVRKSGRKLDDYCVVTFTRDDDSWVISYPEQKTAKLTEGQYEIKVYSYTDSDIVLRGSSSQKCIEVPKSGLGGVLGFTEEKCFDFNIPSQSVGFAISGGGKQKHYIPESQLRESRKIIIDIDDFGVPNKVEDLQVNFNKLEISGLDINFE